MILDKSKGKTIRYFLLLAFIIMVAANGLANYLPINNLTTQQISEMYDNLFTPASYVFSIWGVIYIALFVLVIRLIWSVNRYETLKKNNLLNLVSKLLIVNFIANGSWIVAWHYLKIEWSFAIMLVILLTLIIVMYLLVKYDVTSSDYACIKIPIEIYLGWIVVATLANLTVLLVYYDIINSSNEILWAVSFIVIGMIVGIVGSLLCKGVFYNLVFLWAYYGLIQRYLLIDQSYGMFLIQTVFICMVLIGIALLITIFQLFKTNSSRY